MKEEPNNNINDGGPAFPCLGSNGMTVRQYYATKALSSLDMTSLREDYEFAVDSSDYSIFLEEIRRISQIALYLADALMECETEQKQWLDAQNRLEGDAEK